MLNRHPNNYGRFTTFYVLEPDPTTVRRETAPRYWQHLLLSHARQSLNRRSPLALRRLKCTYARPTKRC